MDADVDCGSLIIGVVLEDWAHKVDVKFEDGDVEQSDLLELKGVVQDNLSLSVLFDSSIFVVIILELSNANSLLQ